VCLRLTLLAAVSWFAPTPVAAQAQPRSAADVQSTGAASEFQNLAAAVILDRGVTCLDSAELVEHVASWLGSDSVSAQLQIEVHGSPYFARNLWFRIRRGSTVIAERRFEPAPARCADLHAAMGLAIALALKASLLDSLIGKRTDTLAHRFRFAAQALGGVAVIPGLDFGVDLSLQYAVTQRFAARLTAIGLFGAFGDFAQDQGRFKTWLTVGRFDICSLLADFDSLNISACLGVAAGGLYASGEAFPMSRSMLISYIAVANALELDIELSRHWTLSLAVDVLVPLRRTSFVVRDEEGRILADNDLAAAGVLIAFGPAYHF
jgi:hypothetical protein